VAGLAVIGFGLHLLVTIAAILSERLGRLRRQRQPRRGPALRRSRPPTSDPPFDSMVDLRGRIRSRRRRSRITFVSVLVSVFAGTVLNQTGQAVEVILITMLVYLSLSLLTSLFMNWFNARMALVER